MQWLVPCNSSGQTTDNIMFIRLGWCTCQDIAYKRGLALLPCSVISSRSLCLYLLLGTAAIPGSDLWKFLYDKRLTSFTSRMTYTMQYVTSSSMIETAVPLHLWESAFVTTQQGQNGLSPSMSFGTYPKILFGISATVVSLKTFLKLSDTKPTPENTGSIIVNFFIIDLLASLAIHSEIITDGGSQFMYSFSWVI